MTGRNSIPAILSNASSVDIQMKFKNRKFIARELGLQDWQNYDEDHCDTYQNRFFEDSRKFVTDEEYETYLKFGCPIKNVEEQVVCIVF